MSPPPLPPLDKLKGSSTNAASQVSSAKMTFSTKIT